MSGLLFDCLVIGCVYVAFGVALCLGGGRAPAIGLIDDHYIRRHGRLAPAGFWLVALVAVVLSWPRLFWGRE
jgi:hypothetical protein